jgi:hypothetical protein
MGRTRLHPYITKKEKFEPPLRDRIPTVTNRLRDEWAPLGPNTVIPRRCSEWPRIWTSCLPRWQARGFVSYR